VFYLAFIALASAAGPSKRFEANICTRSKIPSDLDVVFSSLDFNNVCREEVPEIKRGTETFSTLVSTEVSGRSSCGSDVSVTAGRWLKFRGYDSKSTTISACKGDDKGELLISVCLSIQIRYLSSYGINHRV
jgi:hypothetical protein